MRALILALGLSFIFSAAQAKAPCSALLAGDASLNHMGAACTVGETLGQGPYTLCRWDYSYRSIRSQAWLATLKQEVEECLGSNAALPDDTQVNHPDSYTLHRYQAKGVHVALSLKDKAALSKSLVFLRIHTPQ